MVVDVDKFTDAELRTKLLEFGFPVMPITGTTRKVLQKKLKLLLENQNKISSNSGGRKSLGRYSSEDDSDVDIKPEKKEKRRVTMAAPTMQPPSSRTTRKQEPEINDSPPKKGELRNSITSSTTTRTKRIIKSSQDEFDTGSESESDIMVSGKKYLSPSVTNNDTEYRRDSPIKSTLSSSTGRISPEISRDVSYSSTRNVSFGAPTSPGRVSSYISPATSSASDYAGDRLNQIRARLSLGTNSYERPSYSSTLNSEKIEPEAGETPFLSNFTRRLSALSANKKAELDNKNDVIKEHDSNGSSSYTKSYLSSYRGTARGRDAIYDYKSNQKSIWKNNFVSFSVLAGAALFFLFLAIMYLGIRSDTSVDLTGVTTPICVRLDPNSKKGVNCLLQEELETTMYLLNVLKPELHKRAVAFKCFDATIKPQMTEAEIITFCKTNFHVDDEYQIQKDLKNLEIMTFENPTWGLGVVQRENNNGAAGVEDLAKNMEEVIFNGKKVTSLMEINPELPLRCTIYQSFSLILKTTLMLVTIFGLIYMSNLSYKYYNRHVEQQREELRQLVEKIIDILQNSASEEETNDQFVVINHVRDMILPLADRKRKSKLWEDAVKYINENESRVRTEIQSVRGEPFEVWRWIGAANVSLGESPRSKVWQGQAFETQVGSVNSLPCSPTSCLKIRGMVEDGDRNTQMIREAVLNKCAHQCNILHCVVDTKTNCVYLKCGDTADSAIAYRNLHSWWYAGHLVTVKYLRLERYMQRFPDSPVKGPPFLKAPNPSTE